MSFFDENIPSEWVSKSLGSMGDFFGGVTSITKQDYGHGTPFLPFKNVFNNSKVDISALELMNVKEKDLKKRNCSYGDIFFTASSETDDEVAMSSVLLDNVKNLTYNGFCKRYRLHSFNELNPKFARYFFRSRIFRGLIKQVVTGDVRFNISQETLSNVKISIPKNIEEQKAIAKVLTVFDDKIELLQAQNNTLEAMAQTIFKEWFGKYQIGDELPEGWRVGILDDLFGELATGNRPKGGVGNLSSGIPSIGAESIGGISNFDYSKTKYVSKEFFLNMKRGVVKEYDILIYKDGGTPGTFIPKFSMFGEGFPFKEFCINSHVFRVQPKNIHHRFYIYQWLNSYYCKWQLKSIGGKAAIPGINSTDLKNLDVIIPCDKLLYKYHDLVKNKYKKILKNMVQIQSLTKTRDTLLPKLMSGQVRVNNIKQPANA